MKNNLIILDIVKTFSEAVQLQAKEVQLIVSDMMDGKDVTEQELTEAYNGLTEAMDNLNEAIKLL